MSPLKQTTDLFHLTSLFSTSTASFTPSKSMISTSPMSNRFSPSAARRNKNNSPDLHSPAPVKVPSRRKKLVDARNPLRDLNGAAPICNSGDVSSSSSIEAPRGCLGFFLSHSSSSSRNKPHHSRSGAVPETPKSASAPKLRKNPRFRKRPIACQKNRSLSISSEERAESVKELQPRELGQVNLGNESASDSTPVAETEMNADLGFEQQSGAKQVLEEKSDDSKIKTPPLLPSLSPEIQTGSNAFPVMEMKQTCYGTSHLLSGVPDKRKCRPRGVLCVRAKGSIFDSSSVDEDTDLAKRSDFSPVLLPQEASVHWFSSPKVAEFEDSPSLCFSSDFSKKSGSFATYSSMDTSSSTSNNSNLRLGFQGFVNFECSSPIEMNTPRVSASKQENNAQFLNSPLLSSGNIIQTPSSGSAADRRRLADLVTDNVDPGFRLDMAQVQRVLDCRECWVSDSTVSAFKSRSPLRISWRDGLVGRIIDMDDDDLCRCFSDDEEISTANLKTLIHTPEKIPDEPRIEVSNKEMHQIRVQCAAMESMSLDGDRLMESSDSDWNLCYRNELFRV